MNQGRVVFGVLKRRLLKVPKTNSTRPTSDIIKESIFNVLLHRFNIDFSKTLIIDLFAGSGGLGIESVSLGCKNAIFIDNNNFSIKCINENLESLKISEFSTIINKKAEEISDKYILDIATNFENIIVFMDPPYKEKEQLFFQITRFTKILKHKELIIIAETDKENLPNEFLFKHKLKHGKTNVFFI